MTETRGMSRIEKLKYQAKQRRLQGKSKLKISMEAFSPEIMHDTDMESMDAWKESGVFDTMLKTLGEGNEDQD